MTLTIGRLFPALGNVHGDLENARVLVARARWAGLDAHAVELDDPADLARVDALVIGSAPDGVLAALAERVRSAAAELAARVRDGLPVLAVGTGMELLGERVTIDGVEVRGAGVLPIETTPLPARIATEIVVETPAGRLVGFENHARGVRADAAITLGRVLLGHGNDGATEGARVANLVGTHVHGPVLAKNPVLADEILALLSDDYAPDADGIRRVDEIAAGARRAFAERVGVPIGEGRG